MKKRFFSYSFLQTGLLFVFLLFFSCSKRQEVVPSAEFAPYVSAYTGGMISASSSIRIELTQPLSSVEVGVEVNDKLFDFSPKLKGKTTWLNNNTVEFVPDSGQLRQGELYLASFKLEKVTKVEKELKSFEFSFRVAPQNFVFKELSTTIKSGNPTQLSIGGELCFSETVSIEKVKEMLSVKSSGQSPEINLLPTNHPKTFSFSIENINRGDKDSELTLIANGKAIGVNKSEEETIEIPARFPFRLLYAKIVGEERNTIQVAFSDVVDTEQDLSAYINIGEVTSSTFQAVDNKVNLFFESGSRTHLTVNVLSGIKNESGHALERTSHVSLHMDSYKPMVEIPVKGNILPDSKELILPFRAVSLAAVDMKVIRIFENNVLSFMQNNDLAGSNELRRSGRLIYKKTLRLDNDPQKDLHAWEDYSVDLADIIKQEPGAIYRIELSFKQAYSVYPCGGSERMQSAVSEGEGMVNILSGELTEEDENTWDLPYTYYYESDAYDWSLYNWQEREDPCKPSYYTPSNCKAACNVLASNLGLIAKTGSTNRLWATVNDIITTHPVADTEVNVYNFQLQKIGSGKTDSKGFAEIDLKGKPFVVVARQGEQKTYLKMVDGEEKSLSRFDIEGKEIKKGLKGYLYGERGVWRPGDTLYVSFILQDKEGRIPDKHPVTFELYNPKGQFYTKQVSANGMNGFYTFPVPTRQEDPTGIWNAYCKVGGATFHKPLRVETVKPNRLKINLELKGERIDASKGNIPVILSSSWLTGATAGHLKTKVEMMLSKSRTQFKGFGNYVFDNPATDFYRSESEVFSGSLNADGKVNFTMKVPQAMTAPGMLSANLVCRVFEQGGDASIYTQTIPFSPYETYVGVNLNEQSNGKWLETDQDHVFDVVSLDADGQPKSVEDLDYEVYRIDWRWWWESRGESFESYVNGSTTKPVLSGSVRTSAQGKGQFKFRVNYPDWGRYLVYVKDKKGGHATGGIVYVDWPDWRGRSAKGDPSGVSMLTFSTDKTSYEVGEEVTVIIPAAAEGRALIALENGSAVLMRDWVSTVKGSDTKYKFKVTEEMTPNFYIHISLLQAHEQTLNDLPIRMYGVVPVFVSNKASELHPTVKMPDVLRPEQPFEMEVKETNGKPMTYTLAIVDDGLLDLTNFKTPNPWNEFYAREALGVRTWDMYDYVIGAFGGKYSPLFSVGGDEAGKPASQKANRFRPVVKFLGPFSIGKGGSNKHKLQLPMYVGSVRTMVVAGQDGAYGCAEKTVPVRSPLMLLATLPRVVSTGEDIVLPVNVFAMEKEVSQVSIKVETAGKLKITGGNNQTLRFSKPGDAMAYFTLSSGGASGVETVKVTAAGQGHTATETIEIEVRNPNPASVLTQDTLLKAGAEIELSYQMGDLSEESWAKLEVSRIPSADISRRFDFLYDYQHCCSEQLTSKALPLLFISQFKSLSEKEEQTIKENVRAAIKDLYGRQLPNGGFVYWPGQADANEWITSYVGSFLVEAQRKGYEVNSGVVKKWKEYQRRAAQNWSPDYRKKTRYDYNQYDLQQAYRLYTLALSGAAEPGAMNRLKELEGLSLQARWRLAAAYAANGKTKVANEVVFNLKTEVEPYSLSNFTYGSSDRDEAMILETLVMIGNLQQAFRQAKVVSGNLLRENYFSTQSTAFSLLAMGRLAEKVEKGNIQVEWTLNGQQQNAIRTTKAVEQVDLPLKSDISRVTLRNKGTGDVFVTLSSKAKPVVDRLPAEASNLKVDVSYTDLDGKAIAVDGLKQGTDFVAVVKVSNINGNTDYTDLALTHIVPSGWEIFNERMINHDNPEAENTPVNYIYKDIRDDRVLTYFDLGRGLSKTFRVRLQAAYAGKFVLPAILCEAMYDTSAHSRTVAGETRVEQ